MVVPEGGPGRSAPLCPAPGVAPLPAPHRKEKVGLCKNWQAGLLGRRNCDDSLSMLRQKCSLVYFVVFGGRTRSAGSVPGVADEVQSHLCSLSGPGSVF